MNKDFDISLREESLLNEIAEFYLKYKKPVSSFFLAKKLNFRYSPATIRNDCFALAEKGYLKKIHSYSGRIPTDRGLRFYIDKILREKEKQLEDLEKKFIFQLKIFVDQFLKFYQQIDNIKKELAEIIAEKSQSYSFIYSFGDEEIISQGFKFLMEEVEGLEKDRLLILGEFLDNLRDILKELPLKEDLNFFIGEENPYLKLEPLAMIVVRNKKGRILGLLGHKKILYFKNLALLKAGKNLLNKI